MTKTTGVSLPAPDQVYDGPLAFDVRQLPEPLPPIDAKHPPAGAPNVLIVLLDDVGFGASSGFGGPINTPTAERLANGGLKYTRLHTRHCARRPEPRCYQVGPDRPRR
jgi:Sulfatase